MGCVSEDIKYKEVIVSIHHSQTSNLIQRLTVRSQFPQTDDETQSSNLAHYIIIIIIGPCVGENAENAMQAQHQHQHTDKKI